MADKPLTRGQVIDTINGIVADILEKDVGEVRDNANKSFGEIGIDSLAIIEAVDQTEEAFQKHEIRFDDEELREDVLNLHDFHDLTLKKLGL